jgi:hypothetical protein
MLIRRPWTAEDDARLRALLARPRACSGQTSEIGDRGESPIEQAAQVERGSGSTAALIKSSGTKASNPSCRRFRKRGGENAGKINYRPGPTHGVEPKRRRQRKAIPPLLLLRDCPTIRREVLRAGRRSLGKKPRRHGRRDRDRPPLSRVRRSDGKL